MLVRTKNRCRKLFQKYIIFSKNEELVLTLSPVAFRAMFAYDMVAIGTFCTL